MAYIAAANRELLERLNLSRQRTHSDYINADKDEQIAFMKDLEQTLYKEPSTTAIVFADEFSVSMVVLHHISSKE